MANRATPKSTGGNGPAPADDTPAPVTAETTAAQASSGAADAPAAPNTEGVNDAGDAAETPITAPGETVQEQPGGGVDGDAGAAAGNPSSATTAPEAHASDDGGRPEDGDREALEAAVAAITGEMRAIIPKGITLEVLPSDYQVRVTGPKKGRRRAGRSFGREPVSIPIEDLTVQDLIVLQADPALTVEIVQITIPGREAGGQPGEMGTTR